MSIKIDPSPSCAPPQVAGSQWEGVPGPVNCDEAFALRHALQAAWTALQAVPSYVEGQARAFVEECDAQGIQPEAETYSWSRHNEDSTNAHRLVIL